MQHQRLRLKRSQSCTIKMPGKPKKLRRKKYVTLCHICIELLINAAYIEITHGVSIKQVDQL